MSTLIYIRGLARNKFRVPKPGGGFQSVTNTANVQVDLDDQKTQAILFGEKWHFIRVSGSGATTAEISGLTRYGFRVPRSSDDTLTKVSLTDEPVTVDLTDYRVMRILQRNYGRYIATGTPADVAVRGIAHEQVAFEIAAGTAAAASATLTASANPADGDTVTINDKTYRFKDTMAAANDVQIGANSDATLTSLAKAVNQNGTVGTDYFTGTTAPTGVTAGAEDSTNHAVTFTASATGVAGNAYPSTTTSAELSFAHVTFRGGDSGVGASGQTNPTKVFRGVTVSVDSTQPFNYQALRRHYKAWVEA